MRRHVGTLLAASALYGFSIGCVHSLRFGLHNLLKFPLLFLVTGAACAVAYFLFARLVGGQAAWTLRPFFGVRSIPGAETRFVLGSAPDYTGATNFYEAVWHLVRPPPLAADYIRRGRGWD